MQNGTAGEKINDNKKEKMYRKQQMESLVMSRKWEQAGKNL